MTCAPLVRFGEVEVFQEEDESLAVSRPIHTTIVSGDHHTHLYMDDTVHTCGSTHNMCSIVHHAVTHEILDDSLQYTIKVHVALGVM